MPQSPRRNSQTQTNWADQLSANRYAAGAVVALLAASSLDGRTRRTRPTRTRALHHTAYIGPEAVALVLVTWSSAAPRRRGGPGHGQSDQGGEHKGRLNP